MGRKGNVLGGVTPVEWTSRVWQSGICFNAGVSLKSFLFTLKNQNHTTAKKFALKSSEIDNAISCQNTKAPRFSDSDMSIKSECNRKDNTTDCFGNSCINDTEVAPGAVLAGSGTFVVKKIGIFGVTDETAALMNRHQRFRDHNGIEPHQ
jgi:hypothetical protein